MGFLLVAMLIFTGALLAAAYYVWSVPQQHEAEAISMRLRELRMRSGASRAKTGADLIRREKQGTFAFLGEFFEWLGVLRRIQESIDQANLKYRAVDVAAITVILFAGMFLLLGMLGVSSMLLRVLFSLIPAAIPLFIVSKIRARRIAKFEQQFPDAIDLFNRSMKAGHTIHSGLDTIATESSDPIKMEFKKVMEELSLGSQIDAALLNLGKRVPLIDLKFFITGLILQRQTGANMIEVLDNLGLLVRERLNMFAKMKAHTAQQRMSAMLLIGFPIVLGIASWIAAPARMNAFVEDDIGGLIFGFTVFWMLVGVLVIRKIANPKF